MTPIEVFEVNGKTVKLYADEDPESPRNWDNLGTMVCWHRRANLGDEHKYRQPSEFVQSVPKGSVVLPLFLYEHSGMTMSTSNAGYPFNDPWDAGQVGYIFCAPDTIRKEYGVKRISRKTREKVEAVLRQEVATYDEYLTGDVYMYEVEDADGEFLDSCCGLYGWDYAKEQATDAAKAA